jgi:hypothetical protein
MNKILIGLALGIMTGLLVLTSTMTSSALAVPLVTQQKGSGQSSANMMAQLLSGKNVKIGNMTLGFRPGVMVMPLMCMTFSGNLSGLPMLGNMMARNMNQSSMMMGGGAQGNQSMNGLGAMMMRSGMVPSVCFSMSDAMLFRSMMMHGGTMNGMMMGANMTVKPSMASSK